MRPAIGFFAVVLLAFGVLARNASDETLAGASGAGLRVGVLMAIWWFAYPQLQYLPRWLAIACGLVLLLVIRWPKLLLVAIPLLAVLWFLGPRAPRDPTAAK
jgi:hypothetical protein